MAPPVAGAVQFPDVESSLTSTRRRVDPVLHLRRVDPRWKGRSARLEATGINRDLSWSEWSVVSLRTDLALAFPCVVLPPENPDLTCRFQAP